MNAQKSPANLKKEIKKSRETLIQYKINNF